MRFSPLASRFFLFFGEHFFFSPNFHFSSGVGRARRHHNNSRCNGREKIKKGRQPQERPRAGRRKGLFLPKIRARVFSRATKGCDAGPSRSHAFVPIGQRSRGRSARRAPLGRRLEDPQRARCAAEAARRRCRRRRCLPAIFAGALSRRTLFIGPKNGRHTRIMRRKHAYSVPFKTMSVPFAFSFCFFAPSLFIGALLVWG